MEKELNELFEKLERVKKLRNLIEWAYANSMIAADAYHELRGRVNKIFESVLRAIVERMEVG